MEILNLIGKYVIGVLATTGLIANIAVLLIILGVRYKGMEIYIRYNPSDEENDDGASDN